MGYFEINMNMTITFRVKVSYIIGIFSMWQEHSIKNLFFFMKPSSHVQLTCMPFSNSHDSYVALSPLFEFWGFLEVWWGKCPFVITINIYLCNIFVWYMFQKHKILPIVSFQLCSFYMQLVVKTIGLTNQQKYVLMNRTWPQTIYIHE